MPIKSPLYCPFCYIKSAADRIVSDHWHDPEQVRKMIRREGLLLNPISIPVRFPAIPKKQSRFHCKTALCFSDIIRYNHNTCRSPAPYSAFHSSTSSWTSSALISRSSAISSMESPFSIWFPMIRFKVCRVPISIPSLFPRSSPRFSPRFSALFICEL